MTRPCKLCDRSTYSPKGICTRCQTGQRRKVEQPQSGKADVLKPHNHGRFLRQYGIFEDGFRGEWSDEVSEFDMGE